MLAFYYYVLCNRWRYVSNQLHRIWPCRELNFCRKYVDRNFKGPALQLIGWANAVIDAMGHEE